MRKTTPQCSNNWDKMCCTKIRNENISTTAIQASRVIKRITQQQHITNDGTLNTAQCAFQTISRYFTKPCTAGAVNVPDFIVVI